jgi:peptidoglycan hydrolase-like protein with peptidoglycan-binding domain
MDRVHFMGYISCPRTGGFGPCTKAALQAFQQKYGVNGELGIVGPKTLEVLNQKFGVKVI